MVLPLDIRFTEPAAPLFIDCDGDSFDCLFVLSTSQVQYGGSSQTQRSTANSRKRDREDTAHEAPRIKKPMKVVQVAQLPTPTTRASIAPRTQSRTATTPMPPPSERQEQFSQPPFAQSSRRAGAMLPPPIPSKAWNTRTPPVEEFESDAEPLFLPCSQLSQAEIDVLKSTGLGIEDMNADELANMLDGEGEEVDFGYVPPSQEVEQMDLEESGSPSSFDPVDVFGATQSSDNQKACIILRCGRPVLTFPIDFDCHPDLSTAIRRLITNRGVGTC